MSSFTRKVFPLLVLASLTVACRGIVLVRPPARQATVVTVNQNEDRRPLGIPPGHLPPPGMCRLWVPGRPPGRQAASGGCDVVQRSAPAGSWVLYRPAGDAKVVHTRVIDSRRPGVILVVRVYDAQRGNYLRVEGR